MAKTKWKLDPSHSEVTFKVKHLMITNVSGMVGKFDVEVETEDDDFTKATSVTFTADVRSVTTFQTQRDAHLMSDDFFNAEEFPQLKFTGRKYERLDDGSFSLHGDLTIRDISKPVTLDVEYSGKVVDAYGQLHAGFSIEGKIHRKEFGLKWHAVTEAGSIVAGDEVRVHCEIQLVKTEE